MGNGRVPERKDPNLRMDRSDDSGYIDGLKGNEIMIRDMWNGCDGPAQGSSGLCNVKGEWYYLPGRADRGAYYPAMRSSLGICLLQLLFPCFLARNRR